MAWSRPTLSELDSRITSDYQSNIPGANTLLRRSALKVMATVQAGVVHLTYSFLDYIYRQMFATTADTNGLENIAGEYGLSRNIAVSATGTGTATGVTGVVIPAATEIQTDDSIIYEIDADVTIAAGVATVAFTAQTGGADGNQDSGTDLFFVSPVAGVDTTITTTTAISGGTDEEIDFDLRQRVLLRKRQPPHGGAEADYEVWAKEVSGVTRAWSLPLYQGRGTVGVAFVLDDQVGTIFPDQTKTDEVEAYIIAHIDPGSGKTVGIPVTAEPGLFMVSLTPTTIDLSIGLNPNNATVQAQVTTELESLILNKGGPAQTIYISEIREAISSAAGELYHNLISPVADITSSTQQIHTLGTITWSDYV